MPSIHQTPSSNIKFQADWSVDSSVITSYKSPSKGERKYKEAQDFFKKHDAEIKEMTHVNTILYYVLDKEPRFCFLLRPKLKNLNKGKLMFIDSKEPNLFSFNFFNKGLTHAKRWEKVLKDIESLKDKINFTFEENLYKDSLSLSSSRVHPSLRIVLNETLMSRTLSDGGFKESQIDLFERAVKRAKEMAALL